MIDIKELRIGNLVERDGLVFNVWDLKRDGLQLDSVILDRHIKYNSYDDIKPIPLTKEWLERLGLKPFGKYSYTKGKFIIHYRSRENVFRINKRYSSITTVHQLQNLCFSLTGEELQLKD